MKKILIESQFLLPYQNPTNEIKVGGSQRYTIELARLLKSEGYDVYFVTKTEKDFEFYWDNTIHIKSFKCAKGSYGNRDFARRVYDYALKLDVDRVIYSDLQLAMWKCYPQSIGIQHGIDWDGPSFTIKTLIQNLEYIIACRKLSKIICVDTNFINWTRIYNKDIYKFPDKYKFIPNFADENQFNIQERSAIEGPPILLYPRRLVDHRGYSIFIGICNELKRRNYKFKAVLACDELDPTKRQEIVNSSEFDLEIVHPKMDEIDVLFRKAFITFVPTLWSEGTSLSAIESISCGCPVIASNVGGLSNVIVGDFNGKLVEPNIAAFVDATIEFFENPELRTDMSLNCKLISENFTLSKWKDRIMKVITSLER